MLNHAAFRDLRHSISKIFIDIFEIKRVFIGDGYIK
jgi:hypothetical protein